MIVVTASPSDIPYNNIVCRLIFASTRGP